MTNPICMYDFTLTVNDILHTDIIDWLKEWAKEWKFQEEQSDTGYLHYQGRFSLVKKRRLIEIAKLIPFPMHLSPTSNAGSTSFCYVMKADTRTRGPWKSTDDVPVLTRQLRQFLLHDRYEWQEQVMGMCLEIDDRSIKLIYDPIGANGKSILCEFLEYQGLAFEVPPFRLMEDLMQCVMAVKTYPAYLIDMPRGMKKDKLGEFYAGLECIKNGTAYDKRYNFRKKRFDRPQVFVFTNRLPDWDLLSADRWETWEMTPERALRHYRCNSEEPCFF